MKTKIYAFLGSASTALGVASDKLGIMFWLLITLACCMVLDYVTGFAASKKEAIEHPNDTKYGWSSKRGTLGILKKLAYITTIGAAVALDFVILKGIESIGVSIPIKTLFTPIITIWWILNEILSIVENSGRMGADVPQWLTQVICVLKNKVEEKASENDE